ncbi:hypothetical protein GQ53DRAFT_515084 [Thozetella sp. PMI_491]|nr:hypothetical protein GQ53DRAFT_515084 [Thozetella sp. PMI_491]
MDGSGREDARVRIGAPLPTPFSPHWASTAHGRASSSQSWYLLLRPQDVLQSWRVLDCRRLAESTRSSLSIIGGTTMPCKIFARSRGDGYACWGSAGRGRATILAGKFPAYGSVSSLRRFSQHFNGGWMGKGNDMRTVYENRRGGAPEQVLK